MKHQLQKYGLSGATDLDTFYKNYLGDEIYEILFGKLKFKELEEKTLTLLREVVLEFSNHIPQFDHVIREDVGSSDKTPSYIDGKLLLYFGVQMPLSGTRTQFVGLAYKLLGQGRLKFTLYIAGAVEGSNLVSNVNFTANTKAIERKEFEDLESFQQLLPTIQGLSKDFRSTLTQLKGGAIGFTPEQCWENHKKIKETSNTAAWLAQSRELAAKYWTSHKKTLSQGEISALTERFKSNNNERWEYFMHLIFSGFPEDQAFKESLE